MRKIVGWLDAHREDGMAFLRPHRSGGDPPAALALIRLFSSIGLMVHGAGRLPFNYGRRRAGLD